MARAACKAAIDGAYLASVGDQAQNSKEIEKVFDSRGGSKIVWKIADLCAELSAMVNAALRGDD